MHTLVVVGLAIVCRISAQPTFQSTLFDLPTDLPSEDYVYLAQLEDAARNDAKQTIKPKKINKAALGSPQVEPPTPPPSIVQPQYIPQPTVAVTLAPFSFPTYPTLSGAALPSNFTFAPLSFPMNFTLPPPPFILPTHPTLAPLVFPSHPTLPPFQFPTHPTLAPFTMTPPSQPSLIGNVQPTQYQMNQSPPQIIQTPQQTQFGNTLMATSFNEVQQQNVAPTHPYTPGGLSPQPALPQYHNQQQQTIQQPLHQFSYQNQNAVYNPTPYGILSPSPSTQPHFTQPQVHAAQPTQQQQRLQERYDEKLYRQSTYISQAKQNYDSRPPSQYLLQSNGETQRYVRYQTGQQQELLQLKNEQSSDRVNGPVQRVSSSTANRVSIWFKEEFDTSECEKNLTSVAEKFREKFPASLQKGGKDVALSDLVEQRLLECNRKLNTSHWDKVDELLGKISLSKSEESECRNGLVQERISCINLLHYACQFVERSYTFRLVPARITIQEARQAESGAEKCRKVVRMVRKRLEG